MLTEDLACDAVFHALADPSRRAIFESLVRDELAVKDLTARFPMSQPAVSQHLAELRTAGLVSGRREGRCVYYRAEPEGLAPLTRWLETYRTFWPAKIEALNQLLETLE